MTLQQKTFHIIETMPEEQLTQVLMFAEFLQMNTGRVTPKKRQSVNDDGYIRKPGVLKRKMVMADDFDETPDCFKEYM